MRHVATQQKKAKGQPNVTQNLSLSKYNDCVREVAERIKNSLERQSFLDQWLFNCCDFDRLYKDGNMIYFLCGDTEKTYWNLEETPLEDDKSDLLYDCLF